ncbi:hypothetical protein EV193_101919 [Herbihabitans rhizosphaerae]|uniref:Uncharacterized protein n=1 Tax=Herbihabitans rhizosphaerae TaxID=1872711 RepID=A0A4Q7L6P9_9PSEU|nr:hypothetical protein EV193_101919 [Herbihabitans rhizosphaerae]
MIRPAGHSRWNRADIGAIAMIIPVSASICRPASVGVAPSAPCSQKIRNGVSPSVVSRVAKLSAMLAVNDGIRNSRTSISASGPRRRWVTTNAIDTSAPTASGSRTPGRLQPTSGPASTA